MAHKIVTINGNRLFELTHMGDKQFCTIENVGEVEYYAYNQMGEGYSVAELNTIEIVELMTTGEVECSGGTIKPFKPHME